MAVVIVTLMVRKNLELAATSFNSLPENSRRRSSSILGNFFTPLNLNEEAETTIRASEQMEELREMKGRLYSM